VNFSLNDPTGGRLSAAFKVTDDSGRATVQYIAGGATSASNAVVVTATVEGVDKINCEGTEVASNGGCLTRLTVALKQVFISLGTGDKVEIVDAVTYKYPYKALVTDINGAPIPEAEVVLSIVSIAYSTGGYLDFSDGWVRTESGFCPNEDVNFNGVLDQGEDINSNSRLDPGGVATFIAGENSAVEGNTVKVKTGSDGFASFDIMYAKQYAFWVKVRLTARIEVAGSEDIADDEFFLVGAADDYSDEKVAPPGQISSFGLSCGIGCTCYSTNSP
jgi:adhesin/invasin